MLGSCALTMKLCNEPQKLGHGALVSQRASSGEQTSVMGMRRSLFAGSAKKDRRGAFGSEGACGRAPQHSRWADLACRRVLLDRVELSDRGLVGAVAGRPHTSTLADPFPNSRSAGGGGSGAAIPSTGPVISFAREGERFERPGVTGRTAPR